MRIVALIFLGLVCLPLAAQAQQSVDLLLPPSLETPDAPFYRGARVKLGDDVMPVTEGRLPNGVLAQYQPENKKVVVSDDGNISENRKAQALMDVVTALQVGTIETAAGSAE